MIQNKFNLAEEMAKNLNSVNYLDIKSTKLNVILESLNKAAALMDNMDLSHHAENLTKLIEHLNKKI